jgi:SAM-dependent methyltransferase
MTFELASRLPGATERVLIEPSSRFCQWAERLLLREDFDGWIPMPLDSGRPGYRRIDHDRLPRAVPHLSIHNTTAAGVPRPQDHFDVVTCLNVVDRVEDPGETVHVVGRLVRPGGLLVLASPHHFTPEFTPTHKWVTDLRELLDPGEWTVNDRECEASYDFTYYQRHHSHFVSQVIGAVRKG